MSDLSKTRLFPDGFIVLEMVSEAPERERPFWRCLRDMLRFQEYLQLFSKSQLDFESSRFAEQTRNRSSVDSSKTSTVKQSGENAFPGLDSKKKSKSKLPVCIHSDVHQLYDGTVQRWAGSAAAKAASHWSELAWL